MRKVRFAAAGMMAIGLATVVGAYSSGAMTQSSSTRSAGAVKVIGCVERDNGTAMAGSAGSGTSTAANATSGTNAAAFMLTKLDPNSLKRATAALGKTTTVSGAASSTSPEPDASLNLAKAHEFVLRPETGKVNLGHYVNQRVEVTGMFVDAAMSLAGPTSAGATGTAGASGTVSTSNLNTPGLNVTAVRTVAASCR